MQKFNNWYGEDHFPNIELINYYRDKLLMENPDCEDFDQLKNKAYELALEHTNKEKQEREMRRKSEELDRIKEDLKRRLYSLGSPLHLTNHFPRWELYKTQLEQQKSIMEEQLDNAKKLAGKIIEKIIPNDTTVKDKKHPRKERQW
jgi:hypothetical protein